MEPFTNMERYVRGERQPHQDKTLQLGLVLAGCVQCSCVLCKIHITKGYTSIIRFYLSPCTRANYQPRIRFVDEDERNNLHTKSKR